MYVNSMIQCYSVSIGKNLLAAAQDSLGNMLYWVLIRALRFSSLLSMRLLVVVLMEGANLFGLREFITWQQDILFVVFIYF